MLKELVTRYKQLSICQSDIQKSVDALIACYNTGGKVLTCGNGGSCADCDHIVGELMKGFLKKRPLTSTQKENMLKNAPLLDVELLNKLQCGLPAIALPFFSALNSAFCNDVTPDLIYAQSVMAMGRPGDVLIAISTSGNAKNVYAAAKVAKGLCLTVIGLTGKNNSNLSEIADICIRVPEVETFKVQELHLPIPFFVCRHRGAFLYRIILSREDCYVSSPNCGFF